MKRSGFFSLFLMLGLMPFFASTSSAQSRADTLREVEVKAERSRTELTKNSFLPGAKIIQLDSALLQQYQQQSIASLISEASSVFVKSYGFNSLATLSFRGASAAQSAVYWQGIPLSNAGTGLTDISLLPVLFADSISLQYGGSGALGGSGNIGGALLLENKAANFSPVNKLTGSAQLGFGSFNQKTAAATLGFSNKHFDLRARAIYSDADNDFKVPISGGGIYEAKNAALSGGGLMLDGFLKINSKNILAAHFWQQAYQREIPRALFESSSVKYQDDAATRALLQWNRFGIKTQSYFKAAFLEDRFAYEDSSIQLSSNITTRHLYGEMGISGNLDEHTVWQVFAPIQYMSLSGNNAPSQFRLALAGSVRRNYFEDRLSLALNARWESFGGVFILLPGGSGSFALSKDFEIKTSIQKTYRAPNLNELYYQPGGNQFLKPEHGWSGELGYVFKNSLNENFAFSHSITGYYRDIEDWIIWLGGAVWTPHNLAEVISRGLETENFISGKMATIRWQVGLSLAYTRSSPTKSYLSNDNSVGHQIPYTPFFTSNLSAKLSWKNFSATYLNSLVGKRFITSDESASISSYSNGNIYLSYATGKTRPKWQVNLAVQNLWNAHYQIVAYRPMPGIHYQLGLVVSIY
ncbi:MAG: TonB-dependent receptor [Chitinophagaceae bacterium]